MDTQMTPENFYERLDVVTQETIRGLVQRFEGANLEVYVCGGALETPNPRDIDIVVTGRDVEEKDTERGEGSLGITEDTFDLLLEGATYGHLSENPIFGKGLNFLIDDKNGPKESLEEDPLTLNPIDPIGFDDTPVNKSIFPLDKLGDKDYSDLIKKYFPEADGIKNYLSIDGKPSVSCFRDISVPRDNFPTWAGKRTHDNYQKFLHNIVNGLGPSSELEIIDEMSTEDPFDPFTYAGSTMTDRIQFRFEGVEFDVVYAKKPFDAEPETERVLLTPDRNIYNTQL
jgi:hypothetical protein